MPFLMQMRLIINVPYSQRSALLARAINVALFTFILKKDVYYRLKIWGL